MNPANIEGQRQAMSEADRLQFKLQNSISNNDDYENEELLSQVISKY